MAVAGSLEIELFASIARLQKDMDAATKSVGGAMAKVDRAVGLAQKALLGLGVGVSLNALFGNVSKAVDALAKLDDMAQKTGSSVENLSRMQKVAVQFGQDFDNVNSALNKFSKGLAGVEEDTGTASKTTQALKALGITQKFVKDNDPSQVMVEVAKKLQNYQDGASKAALATDLFGKAGVELLPYLNDLAENVDRFTGASAKSAAEAAYLQDQMGYFKVKSEEFSTVIASAVIPGLTELTTKFIDNAREGGIFLAILKSIGDIEEQALFGSQKTQRANRMASIDREIQAKQLQLSGGTMRTDMGIVPMDQRAIDQTTAQIRLLALEKNDLLNVEKRLNDESKNSPYTSPNANKAILDYNSATAATKDAIGDQLKALAQVNQLLMQGVPLEDANTISKLKAAGATDEQVVKILSLTAQQKTYLDTLKENEEFMERQGKAEYDRLTQQDKATDSILESAAALEEENASFGKLPQQITEVTIARLNDKKAMLESIGLVVPEIDAQIEAYERLRAAQSGKQMLEAEKKAQDERVKAYEDANKKIEEDQKRLSDTFSKSLTDAIFRGFEDGKSFAQNFKDTLVNSFKTLVLQPIVKFLVDSSGITKVLTALSGAVSGTASAGGIEGASGGGFGGFGNILNTAKGLFSDGNGAVVKSIEWLGGVMASGNGGIIDSIGGFMGANASAIADGFGYFGAALALSQGKFATAIGTGIGTYFGGPIGAAIGGAIGGVVDSMFGGHVKRPKYYADTTVSATGTTLNSLSKKDGKSATLTQFGQQAVGIGNNIGAYAEAFGGSIAKAFQVSMTYNQKHDLYGINVGRGKTNGDWDVMVKSPQLADGVANAFVLAVKKGFVELPGYIQGIFNRSSSTMGAAGLQNIAAIKQLYESLSDLPPVFKAVKTSIDMFATSDSLAALQAQLAAISTYTSLFYTEQEQFATFTKQLGSQFTSINKVLPATRDGFRSMVDGIDTTTEAGLLLFNQLIALAPATDSYYKSLEAQKAALEEARKPFLQWAEDIKAFGKTLTMGSNALLSPEAAYQATKAEYDRVSALANTGDQTALASFVQTAQAFLDASKEFNASSAGYFADLEKVKSGTATAEISSLAKADVLTVTDLTAAVVAGSQQSVQELKESNEHLSALVRLQSAANLKLIEKLDSLVSTGQVTANQATLVAAS